MACDEEQGTSTGTGLHLTRSERIHTASLRVVCKSHISQRKCPVLPIIDIDFDFGEGEKVLGIGARTIIVQAPRYNDALYGRTRTGQGKFRCQCGNIFARFSALTQESRARGSPEGHKKVLSETARAREREGFAMR
jgi:hypothetical protein